MSETRPDAISVARTERDLEKDEKRIALIKVMKAEKERGYSNGALAQKHNLSESTVRTMLGLDIYTVTFVQLGTDRRTTIDIAAPAGMEYDDVVAKFKRDLS